jgi:anti-sigma B factor antagonist
VKVEEKRHGEVLVLHLSGRLDAPGTNHLVDTLNKAIESGDHNLLLNFENLAYLNSTGLRALLGAQKSIQTRGGKFFICSTKGMVKRVIELVGFNKMLTIYDNEEEALKHF